MSMKNPDGEQHCHVAGGVESERRMRAENLKVLQ